MAEQKYSYEQKQAELAAIDRGSTIHTAAIAAEVSPHTGYRWVKQAGLATSRSSPRQYTDGEKSLFLVRVAEVGNVSNMSHELGINRVPGYAWAHRADIFTSDEANERKAKFLSLHTNGIPRANATRQRGIEQHQAMDWDREIRSFNKGRIYPDGRAVLYNQDQILANVRRPRTTWAQGEHNRLNRVEHVIDTRYLSPREREHITDLSAQGLSIRKIASQLGRAPSTISRELQRNKPFPEQLRHTLT